MPSQPNDNWQEWRCSESYDCPPGSLVTSSTKCQDGHEGGAEEWLLRCQHELDTLYTNTISARRLPISTERDLIPDLARPDGPSGRDDGWAAILPAPTSRNARRQFVAPWWFRTFLRIPCPLHDIRLAAIRSHGGGRLIVLDDHMSVAQGRDVLWSVPYPGRQRKFLISRRCELVLVLGIRQPFADVGHEESPRVYADSQGRRRGKRKRLGWHGSSIPYLPRGKYAQYDRSEFI